MKFIERVRQFSLKKAGYINLTIAVINILIHVFVMAGILPYTWVNGGRTENYEAACSIAFSSIIVIAVTMLLTLIASGIIPVKFNRFFGIFLTVILIVLLPFSFIGIVQQFLGTLFEKCFCSILALISFLTAFRIAFEKRWPEKKV
ncbi:MAG: hypothetical protein J5780_06270 [Treponema sp.]|nr:hypothetical protein [Treponema sp.]